jgi:lipid-binding SYLF domain-containing protein
MLKVKKLFAALAIILVAAGSNALAANTKADLNTDADLALSKLLSTNPVAAELAKNAKGALVFPNIVKAGLVFGGSYGEGVLVERGKITSYYNSIGASIGLQAGAQSYGYVVFLMTDKAIKYLRDTKGWEIGVGPTVAIVDEGVAKNFSTTTLKNDAYAFIFDQQGLMAGINLEGTKITRIKD